MKKSEIDRFCREAVDAGSLTSRHFDEVGIEFKEKFSISEIEATSKDILSGFLMCLQKYDSQIKVLMTYFPLKDTDRISKWRSKSIEGRLISGDEPPSIYAMFSDDVFGAEFEQYIFPIRSDEKYYTVFRSSRSKEGARGNWEFSNAIMVIRYL